MRLVRLLAAGKCVVGLKDGVSPYRLTDQRLLPNFGPTKGSPWPEGKGPGGSAAGGVRSKGGAQGEFRLERVKVVRNDLSDSDLELVELRPKAAAGKPAGARRGRGASFCLPGMRGLLGLFGVNRT